MGWQAKGAADGLVGAQVLADGLAQAEVTATSGGEWAIAVAARRAGRAAMPQSVARERARLPAYAGHTPTGFLAHPLGVW